MKVNRASIAFIGLLSVIVVTVTTVVWISDTPTQVTTPELAAQAVLCEQIKREVSLAADAEDFCSSASINAALDVLAMATVIGEAEREVWANSHERQLYTHQLAAANTILRLSILIAAAGIALVFVQYVISLIEGRPIDEASLEMGPEGFKLRTSFIGFLLILFSLGFWVAYLQNAFEIEDAPEITTSASEPAAATEPTD